MKRARLVVASAIALAGCRAVLGIDALQIDDADGGGGAPDATTLGDAGHDGNVAADTSSPPDSNPPPPPPDSPAGPPDANDTIQQCLGQGQNCSVCCSQNLNGLTAFEHYAAMNGCLCGPGSHCSTQCQQETCANPPSSPEGGTGCFCCEQYYIGSCTDAVDACAHDSTCNDVARCLAQCPTKINCPNP